MCVCLCMCVYVCVYVCVCVCVCIFCVTGMCILVLKSVSVGVHPLVGMPVVNKPRLEPT